MAVCSTCGKEFQGPGTLCHKCAESLNPIELDQDGLPKGVKGWSWGAFFLTWVWAIGNRTWIGLLALIPYVNFIMAIVLGIKGREWAWKNKEWESVEHFQRVQRRWSIWGVALVFGLAGTGIAAAIALPAYMHYVQQAKFLAVVDTLGRGQPILTAYMNNGGGMPMEPATLAQINALAVASPAITSVDAFAVQNYADVGAQITLGKQSGSVYLVTTDGGANWNCKTSLTRFAEAAGCAVVENLERPPVVERYGLWDRPYAEAILNGCVETARKATDETAARNYCNCVVEKVAQQVPQSDVGEGDTPAFNSAMELATVQCGATDQTAAVN
jgi:hypothetical protein